MKHDCESSMLPLNLQFFAGDGDGDGDQSDVQQQNNGGDGAGAGDQSQQKDQNSGSKTFTQEDVNAIGAREKNQGKNSILKLFGCADEKSAKAEAEAFKKWKESNQTEEEKRKQTEELLKNSAFESEKRALADENKLTALAAGISSDSLDDALAIAQLKVTEEKSLEKVLEEMKKEQRYSGFFKSSSQSTGSSASHSGGNSGGKQNIGERLAKSVIASSPSKSSFFKNS